MCLDVRVTWCHLKTKKKIKINQKNSNDYSNSKFTKAVYKITRFLTTQLQTPL